MTTLSRRERIAATRPAKKKLTQERVRELFDYLPETGQLIRKVAVGRKPSTQAGVIIGVPNSDGYLLAMVDWWLRYVHLIVWVWHYGYEPEHQIDHIDRCVTNNRIENLREVTSSCNVRNTGANKRSKTGVKGVHKEPTREGMWMVVINDENKKIRTIKRSSDFTEAVCHRYAAEQCLNWHSCDDNSTAYQYLKQQGILK